MGYFRNYVMISSADAVIAIAGRWGTLNEVSLAISLGKPTILLKGTGGWVDILSDEEISRKFKRKAYVVCSAKEAVELAFKS